MKLGVFVSLRDNLDEKFAFLRDNGFTACQLSNWDDWRETDERAAQVNAAKEKYGIEIEETERDYCKPSSFESKPFKLLEAVMNENFPDVIVSPFLLTAGTDARRFTDVADPILRFAPIDLDSKQYAYLVNVLH